MITSLQLAHEWRSVLSMMYVFIPWWMAHWEEYHTGVMSYGNGLWGVTEANYAVVALHLYTYVLGPQGWLARPLGPLVSSSLLSALLPHGLSAFLASLRINDLFLITFSFLGVSLFVDQVRRVARGAQRADVMMTKKEQGNKTLGMQAAAFHLFQILVTCACGTALLMLPTSVPGESRVLMATFGVTYALQATRLIMAHMAKEPFSIAVWPLVLILLQVGNYYGGGLDTAMLAYAVNAVVVAGYLHYVVSMTNEICAYLGIKALTISPKMDKTK